MNLDETVEFTWWFHGNVEEFLDFMEFSRFYGGFMGISGSFMGISGNGGSFMGFNGIYPLVMTNITDHHL